MWNKADIARQRLEGKLVFAQPMRIDSLRLKAGTGTYHYEAELPIPTAINAGDYCEWNPAVTYLVTPPRKLMLQHGTDTYTFTYVSNPALLGPGKYTCPNIGEFNASSRTIEFVAGQALAEDIWAIVKPDPINPGAFLPSTTQYTICDLQPTDTVVVTYATKAVLDLALTVSRKDYAARTPESSRQDFSVNKTIEARNAVKRARGED